MHDNTPTVLKALICTINDAKMITYINQFQFRLSLLSALRNILPVCFFLNSVLNKMVQIFFFKNSDTVYTNINMFFKKLFQHTKSIDM